MDPTMTELEAITSIEPMIKVLARRHNNSPDVQEDLRQEGRLAAVIAWRRHDPAKGKFSTYAYAYVNWAMTDYVRYTLPMIRITRKGLDKGLRSPDIITLADWRTPR